MKAFYSDEFVLPLPLRVMGWACTMVMGVAAGGLLLA